MASTPHSKRNFSFIGPNDISFRETFYMQYNVDLKPFIVAFSHGVMVSPLGFESGEFKSRYL